MARLNEELARKDREGVRGFHFERVETTIVEFEKIGRMRLGVCHIS